MRAQGSLRPVSPKRRRTTLMRWFSTAAVHRVLERGVEPAWLRATVPAPMPAQLHRHLVDSHAPLRARREAREPAAWWRLDVHHAAPERLHLASLVLRKSIRDVIAGRRSEAGTTAPQQVLRAQAHPPTTLTYASPGTREREPDDRATSRSAQPGEPSSPVAPPAAAIDYDVVTRRVYDEIQRRVAIERERRGY
jgi:hypothetical protein